MAYEPEEQGDRQPQAAPSPALQQFEGAFTDPTAAGWAHEAVTRLNDYFTRRQLADQNAQAGQNFVDDLGQFKTGLVNMVKADPHAVHVAMDLVDPTLRTIIGSMPGQPEDGDVHHAALTGHMQSEIAAAAVTSLAERHEGAARTLLSNDRIQSVLGDDAAHLDSYITLQAQARASDSIAAQERAQLQAARQVDTSALNYLSALHNPATGDVQFPDGWNQGVAADPRLPPAAKLAVGGLYNRLRDGGDAAGSDPYLMADHIAAIAAGDPAHPMEIMQHAGDGLRLADALQLAHAAADPAAKGYFGSLNNLVQQAKTALAPPENGPAGEAAFGRFMDWALPAARNGSIALTPNLFQQFAPTPKDAAGMALAENEATRLGVTTTSREGGGWSYRSGDTIGGNVRYDPFSSPSATQPANENPRIQIAPRPSLGQIFGGTKMAALGTDFITDKLNRIHDLEMERLQEENSPGGTFFRDLLNKQPVATPGGDTPKPTGEG